MSVQVETDPRPAVVDLQARRSTAPVPPVSVQLATSGPWQIIVVEGEMDIQVLPLLPDLRGTIAAQVVFDLLGVTFMDACALRALLDRQRRVTQAGGYVRLVAHSRPVPRLLMLTGTGALFRTFDTLDQALNTPIPTGADEAS